MKIYNEGILVAYSKDGVVILKEGIPERLVPHVIFKELKRRKKFVTREEIIHWLSKRVTPRTQIGIADVLAELGLKLYNVYDIIEKTEGRYLTDKITIDLEGFRGREL